MRTLVARPQRVAPAIPHVPPVSAYEAWLQGEIDAHRKNRRHDQLRPAQMRRVVILHQAGDNFAVIARCMGITRHQAWAAYEGLPEHLK